MPEWVNSPSSVYPSNSFITYVGTAANRDSSEIKALQGIAAVFGQSVKSESTASSRMIQAKADGQVANVNVQAFSQDIQRSVDVDCLIGVETKDFWRDDDGNWYAIAVLDRSKASDIYTTMIKKNYEAISTVLKNIDDEFSFESFSAYDFSEEIANENEKHLKKLSVIQPDSINDLKVYCPSSKKLYAKKMEIAKSIPICIQTFNDEYGRFKEAFSQAIADAGFRGTYDDSVRYMLIAKFEFERSDTSDKKTVRCRYNAESYILDTYTSHQIVPFTVKGRESHVDYEEAKNKAESAMISKIKKDFSQAFYDYIRATVTE